MINVNSIIFRPVDVMDVDLNEFLWIFNAIPMLRVRFDEMEK